MTSYSIKTKQIKFIIVVTNVRRHPGVHTVQIIYILQEAWVFRKSKQSPKYCSEIAKQIAPKKFQKFVVSGELRMS